MVEVPDLLGIVRRFLSDCGIYAHDLRITLISKVDNKWYINIAYKKSGEFFETAASLSLNATTGNVLEFREGWVWMPK